MFFTSQGPINLTLTNVTAEGIVFLEVEPDGSLHANRSVTEIKYEKVAVSVKKWHLNLLFPNAIFPIFSPRGHSSCQYVRYFYGNGKKMWQSELLKLSEGCHYRFRIIVGKHHSDLCICRPLRVPEGTSCDQNISIAELALGKKIKEKRPRRRWQLSNSEDSGL